MLFGAAALLGVALHAHASSSAVSRRGQHVVTCPTNCTSTLQAALFSGASYVLVKPPSGGGPATVGSPDRSTRILANGTDMVVEFAAGL